MDNNVWSKSGIVKGKVAVFDDFDHLEKDFEDRMPKQHHAS
jgi:hypothetical protein